MAARKLVVYKEFTAQLAEFEAEYGSEIIQCETPTGMKAAKASRKDIRDVRSNLEDLRKETKAPVLAKATQIDDEAKAIKEKLTVLFDKFDTAIKAVENAKEIKKQKELDEALAKVTELEDREAAIKAKEIELGLREPDDTATVDDSDGSDSESSSVDGTANDDTNEPVKETSSKASKASTICEPHIKAAAERLAIIKKIRNLVEPTDAQPTGDIDDDIARKHDDALAAIWECVDEYK